MFVIFAEIGIQKRKKNRIKNNISYFKIIRYENMNKSIKVVRSAKNSNLRTKLQLFFAA